MKILIDTSYFLPLIKIGINAIPDKLLIELLSKSSNDYFYSTLTLFELTAKGLKLSSKGDKITPQDIRIGIDAIKNNARLIEISFTDNPLIIELASQFKAIHNDTIDCLIFATAICNCDYIITMDESFFEKLKKSPILIKKVKEINDNFKFWFGDLTGELKALDSNSI
ncbi:MAG: PIN domain-containing protein [Promethearchaeota archaeon]